MENFAKPGTRGELCPIFLLLLMRFSQRIQSSINEKLNEIPQPFRSSTYSLPRCQIIPGSPSLFKGLEGNWVTHDKIRWRDERK